MRDTAKFRAEIIEHLERALALSEHVSEPTVGYPFKSPFPMPRTSTIFDPLLTLNIDRFTFLMNPNHTMTDVNRIKSMGNRGVPPPSWRSQEQHRLTASSGDRKFRVVRS